MKEKADGIAWGLIAKHLSNELNDKEKVDFNGWKKQSGLNNIEIEKAEKIWDLSKNENTDIFSIDNGWNKLHNRIHKKSNFTIGNKNSAFKLNPLLQIAAAILIVLSIGLVIKYFVRPEKYITITADNQSLQRPVILSDGTKVYLNMGSTIVFPKEFGSIRNITLSGEAFFNVTPNKHSPFVIKTTHAQIKVLGTSFNVIANKESDSIQVVVETGRVELTPNNDLRNILLTKGNSGVYYAHSNKLIKSENSDINAFSWKTRSLTFKNASLSYVIRILQKQFAKTIHFENDKLKDYHLTAEYIDLDIDSIFKALNTSHCLKIKKINNEYIISGPGC